MKKIGCFLVVCTVAVTAFSQKDPELKKRLQLFMEASKAMDTKTVLDYTYPKIFTIVPRDQMQDALDKSLHNEQLTMHFDAIKIDSVYPVFTMAGGTYAKINATMKMAMKYNFPKDAPDSSRKAVNAQFLAAMKAQPGVENASADSAGTVTLFAHLPMIAVKDQYSKEWTFSNLKAGDPMNDKLFSKELLQKFGSYK